MLRAQLRRRRGVARPHRRLLREPRRGAALRPPARARRRLHGGLPQRGPGRVAVGRRPDFARGPFPTGAGVDLDHRLLLAATREGRTRHELVERAIALSARALERSDPRRVAADPEAPRSAAWTRRGCATWRCATSWSPPARFDLATAESPRGGGTDPCPYGSGTATCADRRPGDHPRVDAVAAAGDPGACGRRRSRAPAPARPRRGWPSAPRSAGRDGAPTA